MNASQPGTLRSLNLGLSTTLTHLAVGVWVGGMLFFGAVSAPVLFKVARGHQVPEVAPIMVGLILQRFSFLTLVCSVLLIAGWATDGWLSRPTGFRKWWWAAQGGLTLVCVGLGIVLGQVLLPSIAAGQQQVLPAFIKKEAGQPLQPAEVTQLAKFDKLHKEYQQLAVINLWCLVALLVCLVARTNSVSPLEAALGNNKPPGPLN